MTRNQTYRTRRARPAAKDPAARPGPAAQSQAPPPARVPWLPAALTALAAGAVLAWVFWPSLAELAEVWETDPQYSHGYLVPLFSLCLLYLRRGRCDVRAMRPSWWGPPLLVAGCLTRLAGGYFYYFWLERIALLPAVAGLVLTLGGWQAFRWGWPSVAFLVFMMPLPSRLAEAMSPALQRLGTLSSSYLLEVLGLPAVTEGNVILLRDADLGVVEACSGLRMLLTFFAASTAVALVVKRSLWVRVPLFLSAIPIALVVNVLRITVTGVLLETAGEGPAHLVFHDLAGWLMIPMALALLWLVYRLLDNTVVCADADGRNVLQDSLRTAAVPAGRPLAAPPARP
jgi:exosortase